MRPLTREEVVAVIAKVEDLSRTLAKFPGYSREELLEILLRGTALPRAPAAPAQQSLFSAPVSGRVVLNTDGASRGNPGPASVGVVIASPSGELIDTVARVIGRATNNVAEYEAVRAGLMRALELGASSVLVRADSELVVRQLSGQYQVKNAGLRPIYEDIKTIERKFAGGVRYQHVPREMNADADALANAALDAELKPEP